MESATVIQWRPLGEMLVDRGLLTLPALEEALDEQERTGERLGAILVNRKIVAGAVLTTILAEQVGVELETQGGFGSGLFTKIASRNGGSEPAESGPRTLEPTLESPAAGAPVAPPRAFVDELLVKLDHVRGELETERACRAELEVELEAFRAQVVSAPTRRAAATRAGAAKPAAKAKAQSKPKAKATPKARSTRTRASTSPKRTSPR